MTKPKIYLSSPHMGGNEIKYIQEAFDQNWIAPLGPNVDNFEKELCNYSGAKYSAALSSGTAALHLALILLNVKQGDEVICSSFTFSASANPIVYQGATPVFVDSEKDTWNIDPDVLEEAIKDRISKGKKPKAIIVVHLYGQPAKLKELIEISNRYQIPLIEDAAESLGSKYQGKMTGTFGVIGIYSFNGNKIITTSGGGALVSDNKDYVDRSRFLATQARDPAPHYQHSDIGYNYRMSNIVAGIGRGQLQVIEERVKKRRSIFEYYVKTFSSISDIQFLPEYKDTYANRWLTTILLDKKSKVSREDIRLALDADNVESRPLWKPMHLQPIFKDAPYYGGKVCEDLFERGLCLPSGSIMENQDLERVSNLVLKLFK
jgi:dTDP-4-amino-4,6-dideoxygalactose transaminase